MKVKKMKVFNILIVLCLTAFIIPMKVLAQELRTNEKGEKIIVYPDGSWKYYDNNKNDTKTTTTDTKKSTSKKVDSDKRSKDADATSKSKNIKPDTKSTDSKKATTSRSSTSKVDPSKNLSLLELKALDDVSKRKCLEFIDKINNEERKLYQAFKEITLSKIA
ncbi:MAG: hypothetical protein KBA06_03220, partial [Saprospiraceae bacterium]|nr:hypothetical protein [Saprospiraceae bacterium]